MNATRASRAEVCVVACAEAWRGDGATLASPMGLIPSLGARLARLTFSPDLLLNRAMVHGVTQTPNGAHFTSCVPDYGRDEAFQKRYAAAAADPAEWKKFYAGFLETDEAGYQRAVR